MARRAAKTGAFGMPSLTRPPSTQASCLRTIAVAITPRAGDSVSIPIPGGGGVVMRMSLLVLSALVVGAASVATAAPCAYRGQPFVEGDVSCQDGRQFRCAGGKW